MAGRLPCWMAAAAALLGTPLPRRRRPSCPASSSCISTCAPACATQPAHCQPTNLPTLTRTPVHAAQLRCGGVLEAVRISCAGYPTKMPYGAFADHFWPLAPDALRAGADALTRTVVARSRSDAAGYQFGKTKASGWWGGGAWGWGGRPRRHLRAGT